MSSLCGHCRLGPRPWPRRQGGLPTPHFCVRWHPVPVQCVRQGEAAEAARHNVLLQFSRLAPDTAQQGAQPLRGICILQHVRGQWALQAAGAAVAGAAALGCGLATAFAGAARVVSSPEAHRRGAALVQPRHLALPTRSEREVAQFTDHEVVLQLTCFPLDLPQQGLHPRERGGDVVTSGAARRRHGGHRRDRGVCADRAAVPRRALPRTQAAAAGFGSAEPGT
mmetsp:Transcript_106848/g.297475  ORF Transcript_106848/g.297475 Transcript_106848/m.297475 type:complete len:224 (+) Transcript_106848:106-777(+)